MGSHRVGGTWDTVAPIKHTDGKTFLDGKVGIVPGSRSVSSAELVIGLAEDFAFSSYFKNRAIRCFFHSESVPPFGYGIPFLA